MTCDFIQVALYQDKRPEDAAREVAKWMAEFINATAKEMKDFQAGCATDEIEKLRDGMGAQDANKALVPYLMNQLRTLR